MTKRILLLTTLLMLIFGTCYAYNYVDVPGHSTIQVDLDSIKHLNIGADNIIKCNIALYEKSGYTIFTNLIDTDNQTFCSQLVVNYNWDSKEQWRTVNDYKVLSNWNIYNDNDDISTIIKLIKDKEGK